MYNNMECSHGLSLEQECYLCKEDEQKIAQELLISISDKIESKIKRDIPAQAIGDSNNSRLNWNYRNPFRARCYARKGNVNQHEINQDCHCGIYAASSFFEVLRYLNWNKDHKCINNIAVIGTVKLWGKVVQYENGYKGEFAYPKEIYYIPDGWMNKEFMAVFDIELISKAYAVPVHKVKSWKDCPHDKFYGKEQIPILNSQQQSN